MEPKNITSKKTQHKSGFINIIGSPNVGKSTLMNCMLNKNLSIVTHKAQTTRHRIHGIYNEENVQMIFSDTPGIVTPAYKLHEQMLKYVKTAFTDADILIVIVELKETVFKNKELLKHIQELVIPKIVLLNKIDLAEQQEAEKKMELWKTVFSKSEIYPISALHQFGIKELKNRLIELLPYSPPFFAKDQLSDRPEKFFVSEIIREKIFLYYKKEVPYATEVVVENFKEDKNMIYLRTLIIVERETQKGIIIGKKGIALKHVGTTARRDLENFFQKKVYLKMFVKVDKDWRSKEKNLKQYGYIQN